MLTLYHTTDESILHHTTTTGTVADLVRERGMEAISDVATIEGFARTVMEANADKVEQYRSGKQQLAGFFVGQTLVASGSRADPEITQRVVKEMLNSSS